MKIITDEDYTFSPDQSFMSFSNAMKIYHQGKPFSYEKMLKSSREIESFLLLRRIKN